MPIRKLRLVKDFNKAEWFVGTSGFMTSKKQWLALDKLETLEVNSTFYNLPSKRQVDSWAKLPSNINFVFKMSKYVTHSKRLNDCYEGVRMFLDAIDDVKHRTLGILVQLPPSFVQNQTNHNRIKELYGHFSGCSYDIFVEFRHPSWFNETTYSLLERFKWTCVGTWIKKKDDNTAFMGQMPGGLVLPPRRTSGASYVRIHGGRGFRGSLSDAEQIELLESLKSLGARHNYVMFNNTFFSRRGDSKQINGQDVKFAAVCNAVEFQEKV